MSDLQSALGAPVSSPCLDHASALLRARALMSRDGAEVSASGRTQLLDHGSRAQLAVVLLHGITNSPGQFSELGKRLHAQGANVLIPRYPHHGLENRLTRDLEKLTAAELLEAVTEAMDIGHGLGERVVVAGLSLGGILAAWLAQHRDDLDTAVIISPLFALRMVPMPLQAGFARAMAALPNFYVWWNLRLRERMPSPHGYPRVPSRAYVALFDIADRVRHRAQQQPARSRRVVMFTNAHDPATDNRISDQVASDIQVHGGTEVERLELDDALGLPHDLIDPTAAGARVDIVYPILSRLILEA